MKLTIKTRSIELEYEDGYSSITIDSRQNIENLIKTMYEYESMANPRFIQMTPEGTVEEIFNSKTK